MGVNEIPALSSDGHVNVFVEIPKDSQNKYEYDEELGMIVLDRTLHSSVHYPTDYGFVPGTRGADGESLDAMVIVDKSTFSGCLVETRLVGVLTIRSTNGRPEQKLLGVPVRVPRFAEYEDVSDVPGHLLREIEHFFEVFKDLEGSDIGVLGWEGRRRPKGCSNRRSGRRRTKKSPPRLPPELSPRGQPVNGPGCTSILSVQIYVGRLLGDHCQYPGGAVRSSPGTPHSALSQLAWTHWKAVGATASSRASRLRYSVEMHRTPSSGIMHRMFVVRRGKRIGKEEPNVCTREQDLVQPGRAGD